MRLHLVAQSERAPARLGMQAPAHMRYAESRGILVGLKMLAQIFCVKSARDVGDGSLADIEDDLGLDVALKRKHHVAGVDDDSALGRCFIRPSGDKSARPVVPMA